jgi:beta-lactamase class C
MKFRIRFSTLSFAIALLWATHTGAAAPQTELPPQLESYIETLEAKIPDLQGGAIAILYKGQVVYKKTFGNQKNAHGPITASSLFPLASVSKPISALAIAMLVDKGKLSFDEPYKLPYLKNPVTLKNMLSHTTGYKFPGNPEIEKGLGRQKILEKLKTEKPECKPGACYSYSNTTYSLVDDALKQKKLSLTKAMDGLKKSLNIDTIQMVPVSSKFEFAYPHRQIKEDDPKLETLPFPPYYPKAVPAAAGMFATLDLISQKTLNLIHSPVIENRDIDKWRFDWPIDIKDVSSYYAIGWRVLKSKDHPGTDFIFHGGGIKGINTFIGFVPSQDIGIIILLNQNSKVASESGIAFWGEFLK